MHADIQVTNSCLISGIYGFSRFPKRYTNSVNHHCRFVS